MNPELLSEVYEGKLRIFADLPRQAENRDGMGLSSSRGSAS